MSFINMFERNCGTFRRGGGKNPLSLMTLGQFVQNPKKKKQNKKLYLNFKKKQNDHGVVVTIIIVI
jgi:hypothetical protein